MEDYILKHIIDETIFTGFSMPRVSDGWSECGPININRYNHYTVKDGTYFDESKVIDEYSIYLKPNDNKDDSSDTNIDDEEDNTTIEVTSLSDLYELINNSNEDISISYNDSNSKIIDQVTIDKGNKVEIKLESNIDSEGNVGGNGRLFQVNNGELVINGDNNTITASSDSYGVFRVEDTGKLEINDTTLVNSKGWGLNVKVLGGIATLNDVTINSTTGGGIEVTEKTLGTNSQPGLATLNNCTFTQTEYKDHCSTCLSVSGGSKLIVNSGTYISENYCIYVFSSGGFVEIYDGYFEGKNKYCIIAQIDTNTYPSYSGGLQIHGGTFKGDIHIVSPVYMIIDGGSFSFDPTDYIDSTKSKVTFNNTTNLYEVTKL